MNASLLARKVLMYLTSQHWNATNRCMCTTDSRILFYYRWKKFRKLLKIRLVDLLGVAMMCGGGMGVKTRQGFQSRNAEPRSSEPTAWNVHIEESRDHVWKKIWLANYDLKKDLRCSPERDIDRDRLSTRLISSESIDSGGEEAALNKRINLSTESLSPD